MGGCATKPKVLNPDDAPAPAPPPETVKEEAVIATEGNDVAAKEEGEVVAVKKYDKEISNDEDDIVEENESKRRSLSHLFKENEESKDSTENADTTVEPVKQEGLSATEKATDVSETKPIDDEDDESIVKEPTTPVFVDAPEKAEIEKEIEAATPEDAYLEKKATEAAPTMDHSANVTSEIAPKMEVYSEKENENENEAALTRDTSVQKAIDATGTPDSEMLPKEYKIEDENLAAEMEKPEILPNEKKTEEELSVAQTETSEILPKEKKIAEEKIATQPKSIATFEKVKEEI